MCVFPGCFIAQGWAALLVQHWLLLLISLRGNQALGRMFAIMSPFPSLYYFFFHFLSPRSCCTGAGALSNPLSLNASVRPHEGWRAGPCPSGAQGWELSDAPGGNHGSHGPTCVSSCPSELPLAFGMGDSCLPGAPLLFAHAIPQGRVSLAAW